ncbi:hypothetical protein BD410DRAFT_805813 [Rickenella mellea]|uniref:Thioesterase domain-containing protein n=1 Tax=Rickenella mellea TaxID=50990 RepID=A0A4Y7PVG7_9AGAM|nr:hypothetical protein BD410DRAFT_805813 [Rickenella mellea]
MLKASDIPGTAPLEFKTRCFQLFDGYVWQEHDIFGNSVSRKTRILGLNYDDDNESTVPGRKIVRLECELEVTEQMGNKFDCLHGGYAAYFDVSELLYPQQQGGLIGTIISAVIHIIAVSNSPQLNMNVNFHAPAMLGSTIRIVNSTLVISGRLSSERTHVWFCFIDGDDCATHLGIQPSSITLGENSPTLEIVRPIITPPIEWRPKPPITDFKLMPGSASMDVKEAVWTMVEGHTWFGAFCEDIRKTVRLQSVDGDTVAGKRMSMLTAMTNLGGTLHGGCACFLVDWWTGVMRHPLDGDRISINLNVSFHTSAPEGITIQLVARSVSVGKRITDSQCEIVDARTGRLLVSGTHSQITMTKHANL